MNDQIAERVRQKLNKIYESLELSYTFKELQILDLILDKINLSSGILILTDQELKSIEKVIDSRYCSFKIACRNEIYEVLKKKFKNVSYAEFDADKSLSFKISF